VSPAPDKTYVAFLRGVNVGGARKLPMAELRSLLASTGYGDVRTYVQSGNVVFTATPTDTVVLAAELGSVIEERFGFDVVAVVRDAQELAAIASAHPYAGDEEDPKRLHVLFLAQRPSPEQVSGLDPDRSPVDRFVVDGRELYVHYPDGVGRSKFTIDYVERVLGTPATGRNWNTVTKLAELASG